MNWIINQENCFRAQVDSYLIYGEWVRLDNKWFGRFVNDEYISILHTAYSRDELIRKLISSLADGCMKKTKQGRLTNAYGKQIVENVLIDYFNIPPVGQRGWRGV